MKLFDAANTYCKESDWKTMALLKFCLFSMGVMAGMAVPKEKRKLVFGISGLVFLVTYAPLMGKLFEIWRRD